MTQQFKQTVAALGTTAIALASQTAFAQSTVTLYGVADVGIRYLTHSDANNDGRLLMTNGAITSRFGIKGSEDLGNGLKAIFQLESGIDLQSGAQSDSKRIFNRAAYVRLSSNYGTLTLGRQKTPLFLPSYFTALSAYRPGPNATDSHAFSKPDDGLHAGDSACTCLDGRHGCEAVSPVFARGHACVQRSTCIRSNCDIQGKPVIAVVLRKSSTSMKRIAAFCLTTWSAAALLYFGQHSVSLIVLSGVIVFGGFDLLRP